MDGKSFEVRRDRWMVQTAVAFSGWLPAENRFCRVSTPCSFLITSGLAISLDFLLKDSKRLLEECPRLHGRCWCPSGKMCCGASFSVGLENTQEMLCMG